MKILWYMVPEIQGARDKFFCYFGPFYALSPTWLPEKLKTWKIKKHSWRYYHFTHVLHKWKSYDAWFLRCGARQTKLFVILGCFLLFHSPNNPENQNLEKTQKTPGDMCTINNNHMMYVSWEMEDDGNSFFVILDHFLPFHSTKNPKSENFEKLEKTPGDIIILHRSTKNQCSWESTRNGCNFCFSWCAIFCPFTPVKIQKIKIKKKKKKPGYIIILHQCTKSYNYMMYGSWNMVREGRTDRRMDGKSDSWRWVPHLKIVYLFLKKSYCLPETRSFV